MLRVHFLNVGHGDCTIIKHPSGRLTMIDLNNSQDFDAETFAEELYRVPEIVTRGRFPDGGESDSTWRTREARHVGSDTIARGF